MDTAPREPDRRVARERLTYRYALAVEHGDFVTVEAVLRVATRDSVLSGMLQEVDEALAAEIAENARTTRERARTLLARSRAADQRNRARAATPSVLALSTGFGTRSALSNADDSRFQFDPSYSPVVAAALTRAYANLRAADRPDRFAAAATAVSGLPATTMSTRQRVRVYFVIALAAAATRDIEMALHATDEALNLALGLDPAGDLAVLLYFRGGLNRALLRSGDAVADFQDCVALWRQEGGEAPLIDPALYADLLAQLAGLEYYMARYTSAEEHLEEAARLLPAASHDPLAGATFAWIQAHLSRARNDPEQALLPALTAAAIYTSEGNPTSAARIQTLAAEIALDLAEHLPGTQDRQALLTLAFPHIELAHGLASGAEDVIGVALTRLTEVRYSRLSGHNEDRAAAIEQVIHSARGCNDNALLAQAETALADELAATGDSDQARVLYRQALSCVERTDMPALGLAARRALLRWAEMDAQA